MNLDNIQLQLNELLSKEEYKEILPNLKLGIELEVIGPWDSTKSAISSFKSSIGKSSWKTLDTLLDNYKISDKYHGATSFKGWRIEPDSSLPSTTGLEIISPIYNYGTFLEKIPKIVSALKGLGFEGSQSTGLHLNISSDKIDLPNKLREDFYYYRNKYSNFFSAVLAFDRDSRGFFSQGDVSREDRGYSKALIKNLSLYPDLYGGYKKGVTRITLKLDDIIKKESIKVIDLDDILKGESHSVSVSIRNKYVELRGLGGYKGFNKISSKEGLNQVILLAVSQLFRPRKLVSLKEAYRLVSPYIKELSKQLNIAIDISTSTGAERGSLSPQQISDILDSGSPTDILDYDIEITDDLVERLVNSAYFNSGFYGSTITNLPNKVVSMFVKYGLDLIGNPEATSLQKVKAILMLKHIVLKFDVFKKRIVDDSEKVGKAIVALLSTSYITLRQCEGLIDILKLSPELQLELVEVDPPSIEYILNPSYDAIREAYSMLPILGVLNLANAPEDLLIKAVDSIPSYYKVRHYNFPYNPRVFDRYLARISGLQEDDVSRYMYLSEFESVDERLLVEFAEKYPSFIYYYATQHALSDNTKNKLISMTSNPKIREEIKNITGISKFMTNMTSKEYLARVRDYTTDEFKELLNGNKIELTDLIEWARDILQNHNGYFGYHIYGLLDHDLVKKAMSEVFKEYPKDVLWLYIEESPNSKYTFRVMTSYISWLKKYIPKDIQNTIKNDVSIQEIIKEDNYRSSYPKGLLPVLVASGVWSLSDLNSY